MNASIDIDGLHHLLSIEKLCSVELGGAIVDPLFQDYGRWVARQLELNYGAKFTNEDLSRHHEAFRSELHQLQGPRGRLIVARLDDLPVGVGALKPIDDETAEIKRMYVKPEAHGNGIGRALLQALIGEASTLQYRLLRLETLQFMTAAQSMYRAFGFRSISRFDASESATNHVLAQLAIFMELELAGDGHGAAKT